MIGSIEDNLLDIIKIISNKENFNKDDICTIFYNDEKSYDYSLDANYLQAACFHSNLEIVKYFIEEVKIDPYNNDCDNTLIGIFLHRKFHNTESLEILKYLVSINIDYLSINDNNENILHIFMRNINRYENEINNNFIILRYIVEELKISVDHKDYLDRTPMELGDFSNENFVYIKYLISKSNEMEKYLLKYCKYLGNDYIIEQFKKYSLSINRIDLDSFESDIRNINDKFSLSINLLKDISVIDDTFPDYVKINYEKLKKITKDKDGWLKSYI